MWDSPLISFAQTSPDTQLGIMQLLQRNPWIIVVAMALLIPILGIVVGSITEYLRKTRVAEIEAALKRDMLDRGMTPEEIKLVIEASATSNKSKRTHGCCV
jgi:uncharacterized membrane protein YcjF (UPF0283 family)